MTGWPVVFLGVMAVALVAMAAAQLLIGIAVLRATRRLTETTDSIVRDVKPLIENATRLSEDAARVAALAAIQAERVDQLVTSVSAQVTDTMNVVQNAIAEPARQGAAVLAGFRAVMTAVREWQSRPARTSEDDDALFVG